MTNQKPIPDFDAEPTGKGRVKGFSGSGMTASFESQKEVDEHEIHESLKESAKRNPMGIRVSRVAGNSMR